jgi:hypothetical protein
MKANLIKAKLGWFGQSQKNNRIPFISTTFAPENTGVHLSNGRELKTGKR